MLGLFKYTTSYGSLQGHRNSVPKALDNTCPSWHNRHMYSHEEKPMVSSTEQTQEPSNDTQLLGRTVTIAFQGEPGAFGDEAVRAYFNRERQLKPDPIPYHSFADVFRAVAIGEVDYGLVPVENSQAGSINDVYDLLRQHDLFIIGEMSHQVNQCLLSLPGQQLSGIKRVISHPQALAQSEVFLR